MLRLPIATYRLQFNAGFTFDDARRIVAYLAELGISDVYASPILRARSGSTHGYDVVDASVLNPELGTDADFDALDTELKRHGLGFLLDTVPNHMAASAENQWWMSVLENGAHSRYIHYFDIDWEPAAAPGKSAAKVLLPILGRPYGEALESQEIRLAFDHDGFFFTFYDHRLPAAPESYAMILAECMEGLSPEGAGSEIRELVKGDEAAINSRFLKETLWRLYESDSSFRESLDATIGRLNGTPGVPDSFDALDRLLGAQAYRLAYWRIASEKINYRRFFDVAELVGVRVENPEVFEARNRKIFELVADGKVTGLRIDHIDGLYDPIGHMKKMQARLGALGNDLERARSEETDRTGDPALGRSEQEASLPFYVVLEKILAQDEELPKAFPVSGTTGYDFLAVLDGLFVDGAGLARLDASYREFTGITQPFEQIAYERKKQVISELFSGEMRTLGKQLSALALADRNGRDFTPSELLAALTEITASMDVYRTYIRDFDVADADCKAIRRAMNAARRRSAALDPRIFVFLEKILLVEPPPYAAPQREEWLAFVMRWQQFTSRVMAKGVEDTAFYNYNRLLSLNEVGDDPGRLPSIDGLLEFHARNQRVARDWPDTMNATSTHDTKRSDDARARINVLTELAEPWSRQVQRWSHLNEPLRNDGIPDRNVEWMLYQNLAGIWPLHARELPSLPERFRLYLEKASREAKTQTSWLAPDEQWERSLAGFADAILASDGFRQQFGAFQRRVAFYGFLNALAQVVLKITSPGIPDFYRGSELWDFSLVDPDNRRPVDYGVRSKMLAKFRRAGADPSELLRKWPDGRVKLFVTWKALQLRARHAESFRRGSYVALSGGGPNVCAFARGDGIIVAVPRLLTKLVRPRQFPHASVWGDASLEIGGRWKNAFTGETVEGDRLRLADVFATFPVAILERA